MSYESVANTPRAPLLTRMPSTEPPMPYYRSLTASPYPIADDARTDDRAEPSPDPRRARPTRQTQSIFAEPRLPPPSRAAQIVAARPDSALDERFARAKARCSRTSHTWLTQPKMRKQPAAVLALFVSTGAAIGAASMVFAWAQSARRLVVDKGPRQGLTHVEDLTGAAVAVPGAVLCDALAVALTFIGLTLACAAGIVCGLAGPVTAAPVLFFMPEGMRGALADGLCNYLILHQRLDNLEDLLSPSNWHGPKADPRPEVPQGQGGAHDRLAHAYRGLQEHVSSLIHDTPPAAPLPPPQANLQLIAALFSTHPKTAQRIGVPAPPTPQRTLPLLDRLSRRMDSSPRPQNTEAV